MHSLTVRAKSHEICIRPSPNSTSGEFESKSIDVSVHRLHSELTKTIQDTLFGLPDQGAMPSSKACCRRARRRLPLALALALAKKVQALASSIAQLGTQFEKDAALSSLGDFPNCAR